MRLYQIKPKKCLRWPHELTQLSDAQERGLNKRGKEAARRNNLTMRSQEPGFVVDLDAPGEEFFCRVDMRNLEAVPEADVEAARKRIKEQGPITYQPAIDWLREEGLAKEVARPEEADPSQKLEGEAGDIEATPLDKAKKAELEALCDALELPHGKVAEMRAAIAEAAECAKDALLYVDDEGAVCEIEVEED